MGYIINLSGSRGVGKSHVLKKLAEIYDDWYIRENPTKPINSQYNVNIESEYYENERLYINRQLKEYEDIRNTSKNAILVRGTEDLRFYIKKYPESIGKSWNIELNFKAELKCLDECKSDLIIFLYSEKDVIRKRCKKDFEKKRTSIEDWLENWHDDIIRYMKNVEYCVFVDTSDKSFEEVLECVVSLIQKITEKDI